ncbi:MAG TPA: radical SAM protein [Chloroflexota bacterium]|nr:radical SAM protein [Chloroflexota bacterium]
MSRVECVEVDCKSALNRVQGMPFKWSVNPYSGCSHSCHYCYARAYYARAEHGNADRDFETRIYVKRNMPRLLAAELARPAWRGESVALGTATDCYQPIEGRYRLTRALLEVLLAYRNAASLVTKAPLVLRDLDLWAALARAAKVRIYFTITTLDPVVWREIEPGTPNPRRRLEAVRRLNAAGVPTGVLLAPILPGITDSEASLEAVVAGAAEHGAAYLGAAPLRLAPGVREHYLRFVGAARPALLPRYERAYSGTYAPPDYAARLTERVDRLRARYGFGVDAMRERSTRPAPAPAAPPRARRASPQLALPLG